MINDNVDKQLAGALGRIASGLFVLTVRRGEIQTGMLASWVQQCSFQPPLISVAVRGDREIVNLLTTGSSFCLNILEDGQTDMIVHFGRGFALKDDAFTNIEVNREGAGGPILGEALGWLEGVVKAQVPAGDHQLFLAQVVAGKMQTEGHPMVHIRKNGFHY